jgi:hypothetical protein
VRGFNNCRAIRPSITASIYSGFQLNTDYHSPPLTGKFFPRRCALISQRYAAPPKVRRESLAVFLCPCRISAMSITASSLR